ncbi:LAMI_0G02498g1_1 [Lachancea mirantina]|uniref:LAMI_0G02498g1_1 n=1 Tax=Lachancea mirantina TaxID=1230905 RepID=A0A1G4K7U4_9SACH|nr:LAMI_0G02498g1_1 [Lachancea mirantina]
MGNGKLIKNVLTHMKRTGNFVGTAPALGEQSSHRNESDLSKEKEYSRVLKYSSYDPSLTKEDFVRLIPHVRFSDAREPHPLAEFDVWKVRDPRYFQFRDSYHLIFKDFNMLNNYRKSVRLSRIDGLRAVFSVRDKSVKPEDSIAAYVSNLLAAFDSSESYFRALKHCRFVKPDANKSLEQMAEELANAEKKSLLIWNIPPTLRACDVLEKFWFYDIKHWFKLYWDPHTGRNLSFLAFNSELDCTRFRQNFHGAYFSESEECKLLVEALK